jgi:F-type H+-transporting ATPase subunit epsilon
VAHAKFPAEVLTPEGEVFNEEVEMVSTRTSLGQIGILRGHVPLLAMLDPAPLRLYVSDDDVRRYAQAEGYVQVAEGRVLLLVEEATPPDQLDREELAERLRTARERHEGAESGSEEARVAARDVRRAEAFLSMLDEPA